VKTIGAIMGILLTVIGIFVSVFADNLSQYDEKNLYWFSPNNIIDFTINELKYTMQDEDDTIRILKADTIDIQPFNEPIHYIFVVDKTLDSKQDREKYIDKTKFREIIKHRFIAKDPTADTTKLNKNTGSKKSINNKPDNFFDDREDLMLASCILKVYTENPDNTWQVFIYNGELKTEENKYQNEFNVISNSTLSDFLENYGYQSTDDRRPRVTNFARIIDTVTNTLEKDPDKNKYRVITIFSDYVHEDKETKVDIKKVDDAIHSLGTLPHIAVNKKGDKHTKSVKTLLNLVDLEYKNNYQTKYELDKSKNKIRQNINIKQVPNLIDNKKDTISIKLSAYNKGTNDIYITVQSLDTINKIEMYDKVKSLFYHYFHFCHHYSFHEFDILKDTVSQYGYMANIATFPHIDPKKDPHRTFVTFHYPFMSGKFSELYSTYLKFKQSGEFMVSINDNSVVPCDFIMKLSPVTPSPNDTALILKRGDTKRFDISDTVTYMAQFDADRLSKNMEWVFSFQEDSTKQVIKENVPIRFVLKMPKTLCYILILVITLFLLLFVTLIVYFCIKTTMCKQIDCAKCKKCKIP
jgi:hypothetical protein